MTIAVQVRSTLPFLQYFLMGKMLQMRLLLIWNFTLTGYTRLAKTTAITFKTVIGFYITCCGLPNVLPAFHLIMPFLGNRSYWAPWDTFPAGSLWENDIPPPDNPLHIPRPSPPQRPWWGVHRPPSLYRVPWWVLHSTDSPFSSNLPGPLPNKLSAHNTTPGSEVQTPSYIPFVNAATLAISCTSL